ncbi:MAG: putative bifunctional diguanylate cyclase/phosphodiesterase, partial [Burkholderiales bacterium]
IAEDITERKKAEEQLTYLAQYDSLTGLPNRTLFHDRLTTTMARVKRDGKMLALMFLDLDRFKEINDTLGHTIGDEVLQAAAELLRKSLRDVDTIARLGGDEFTIILEDITHEDQVIVVAEKLKKVFVDPIVIKGREIFVTASIGITLYPRDVDDVDALLQTADIAMYRAKEEGRNTYEFYAQEMNAEAAEHLNMENLLRYAIDRQELLLHYQPKVDVKSGRIVGAEALVRWNSKENGLVSPAQFIPLAEKTGLIVPIGEWVLKTACAQNKAWQDQGMPPLLMSVNLSPRQLRQKNLVEMIAEVLDKTGLASRYLELEITEGMIMHHADKAIAILQRINQLGVQLSVDDFGTGYSSLAYLKRFPVQRLKVDQSFVRDLTSDDDDASIVKAVIAMAKSLGLESVAEGVETKEQLDFLSKLRCEEYQEYYFSKPIPAEEFVRLLQARRKVGAA